MPYFQFNVYQTIKLNDTLVFISRYGYFVMKQPNGLMDYSTEGGPTDNCSPNMSVGRGPYR